MECKHITRIAKWLLLSHCSGTRHPVCITHSLPHTTTIYLQTQWLHGQSVERESSPCFQSHIDDALYTCPHIPGHITQWGQVRWASYAELLEFSCCFLCEQQNWTHHPHPHPPHSMNPTPPYTLCIYPYTYALTHTHTWSKWASHSTSRCIK